MGAQAPRNIPLAGQAAERMAERKARGEEAARRMGNTMGRPIPQMNAPQSPMPRRGLRR